MKRKGHFCLIEDIGAVGEDNSDHYRNKKAIASSTPYDSNTMYKTTSWYKSILDAEKSCMKENKIIKIHYKFGDNREMVDEYNIDTQVMLRRAWKVKGKLGGEGRWEVEVGDPIPDATPNIDSVDIMESKDQPQLHKRNTRINLEWRIRNLPYPIETYSVTVDNDAKSIVVRTSNKKYFKKIQVPELLRLNLPMDQANVQVNHAFNTLVIQYRKPQPLMDMEKELYQELLKVKPVKDIPNECKAQ